MAARYAACASCIGGTHNRTHDSIHYGTRTIQAVKMPKVKEILVGSFAYGGISTAAECIKTPRNCLHSDAVVSTEWLHTRPAQATARNDSLKPSDGFLGSAAKEKSARPATSCRARGFNFELGFHTNEGFVRVDQR